MTTKETDNELPDKKLNKDFGKYFAGEVQINHEDTDKSLEIVKPIVNEILKHINEKDGRFSRLASCVGSFWDHLKVGKADEFDMNVKLHHINTFHLQSTTGIRRRYGFDKEVTEELKKIPDDINVVPTDEEPTKFGHPEPDVGYHYLEWKSRTHDLWKESDLFMNDDLVPFLVNRLFKNLLCDAILTINGTLKPGVNVQKTSRVRGPATAIKITSPDHHDILVDFSVSYECDAPWPSYIKWPHDDYKWPNKNKVAEIKCKGVHLVAKKPFYWMQSFALAERELVKDIDVDNGCRKKCHRIMKKLRDDFWCKDQTPVLTIYHLKNVLFWECHSHPEKKSWAPNMVSVRVFSMTKYLAERIDEKLNLPQYFYPEVNLFRHKHKGQLKATAKKIKDWLKEPIFN